MNIAFSALLIFILLFPGILFRIAYLSNPYSRKNIQSSLVDELILSLVPALFIQLIAYLITEHWLKDVDERLLYKLITAAQDVDFDQLQRSIGWFTLYQAAVLCTSVMLGKSAGQAVRYRKLDHKYHLLRPYNEWYYLLSGELLDFPDRPGHSEDIDCIQIDALVETKECTFLYCGILEEFLFSKDNQLERLYLSNVYRRKVADDKHDTGGTFDERYYLMPGDFFVLFVSQIKNMNISYLRLEIETDATPEKTS